ncbi:MAG TPA: phage holin family protein [Trueperaceae bacterium]
MTLLIRWLLNAAALWVTTQLNVGLYFDHPTLASVLLAALVLGLVNAIVRPIMIILTLPLTIITLGLFLLVVNALAVGIVAALTSLNVTSFGGAILGALILTIVSAVLSALVSPKNERRARG